MRMADKETVLDWGIRLSQHLLDISSILPRSVSSRLCSQVEERLLLWQASQETQGDGGLPQGGTSGEDIFRLP